MTATGWRIMEVGAMNQAVQLGDAEAGSPVLAEVCSRYPVKELSPFGSAVRGEMRPESDIDIMVEFKPGVRIGQVKFESLVEELELLAGRRVDLLTKGGLKAWNSPAEPSFLKDILSACGKIEVIIVS
jgi:predicted nucleotidyltransferase